MFKQLSTYKYIFFGIALLAISPFLRQKFDLSEEKKFTLNESSIRIMETLDAPLYVKVYLDEKNTPGGFQRLHKALIATLEELKSHTESKVIIQQIDVYKEYPTEKDRENLAFYLDSLGIPPTNVVNTENGKKTQLMIFPGIVLEKENQSTGILLLKGNKLATPQEILNQSIEGLEFEIIQGVQSLQKKERKKVGFLLDYSQVAAVRQMDLIRALKKKYDLYPVDLGLSSTLDGLDAICLIQPSKVFNSKDVFKIDQFIVRGGKALFLMDGVRIDTIQKQGLLVSQKETGLEEYLFKNGLRLNANLVKDAQLCGAIPLVVGNFGDKPNIQLMPWPAFPLLSGNSTNPITRNLDAIYGRFTSSIDTFQKKGIDKSILLQTGKYTQIQKAPATLPFTASNKDFDAKNYTAGPQIAAVLAQGTFESIFANRPIPNDSLKGYFKAKTDKKGSILLVGDADVALNELDPKTNQSLPLGFDVFAQHTFANKEFLLNAFSYLLDEDKALLARNKEVKLRPLDKDKVLKEKTFWQTITLSLPIVFAILIGVLINLFRKVKYQK